MAVSKTINRIHFDDLSPERFEDLCLSIVYRYSQWDIINHFVRTGHDDGIDIYCEDRLENQETRKWYIQCKRYKRIDKGILNEVLSNIKSSIKPDVFFLIVACDVSKTSIDYFNKLCSDIGIQRSILWTASIIEAELYQKHHDLLFAYFNISLNEKHKNRVSTIRRNIALKKRMNKDFIKPFDITKESWKIWDKFIHSESIIRSIDDTLYPDNELNSLGISPWFKVEMYDFYHNGIEVITGIDEVQINTDEEWFISQYNQNLEKGFSKIKVLRNRLIPYDAIVEYDIDGDEYYNFPHIYCDFKFYGTPYEGKVYRILSDKRNVHSYYPLDNERMIISKQKKVIRKG